jgi:hypothetical protein
MLLQHAITLSYKQVKFANVTNRRDDPARVGAPVTLTCAVLFAQRLNRGDPGGAASASLCAEPIRPGREGVCGYATPL